MKLILLLGLILSLQSKPKRMDITNDFSVNNFEKIKNFVLKNGDRAFFCNMVNNNPHYKFDTIADVYLMPEGGQKNINCDPALSDFDANTRYTLWQKSFPQDYKDCITKHR
jgi:hypothetical protein